MSSYAIGLNLVLGSKPASSRWGMRPLSPWGPTPEYLIFATRHADLEGSLDWDAGRCGSSRCLGCLVGFNLALTRELLGHRHAECF